MMSLEDSKVSVFLHEHVFLVSVEVSSVMM